MAARIPIACGLSVAGLILIIQRTGGNAESRKRDPVTLFDADLALVGSEMKMPRIGFGTCCLLLVVKILVFLVLSTLAVGYCLLPCKHGRGYLRGDVIAFSRGSSIADRYWTTVDQPVRDGGGC